MFPRRNKQDRKRSETPMYIEKKLKYSECVLLQRLEIKLVIAILATRFSAAQVKLFSIF